MPLAGEVHRDDEAQRLDALHRETSAEYGWWHEHIDLIPFKHNPAAMCGLGEWAEKVPVLAALGANTRLLRAVAAGDLGEQVALLSRARRAVRGGSQVCHRRGPVAGHRVQMPPYGREPVVAGNTIVQCVQ
jgi:hypothetical protein